jgi:hypothetical protein
LLPADYILPGTELLDLPAVEANVGEEEGSEDEQELNQYKLAMASSEG